MKTKPEFPKTLKDAIHYFADPDRAIEFMMAVHWPDGKVCCGRCQPAYLNYWIGSINFRRM